MPPRKNLLCFGDNLTFLKNTTLFPDESVDLIYLDPPFNSQRGYNVLFKEVDGTPSASSQPLRTAAAKILRSAQAMPAPCPSEPCSRSCR